MSNPEALEPAFDFSSAPESARLFHGVVELSRKGATHTTAGDVLLRFVPNPRVVIRSSFEMSPDTAFSWCFCDSSELSFRLDGRAIGGWRGPYKAENSRFDLDWNPDHEPIEIGDEQSDRLLSVVSHLFNFPDFMGGQHRPGRLPADCRSLVLVSAGWRVTIQSLTDGATEAVWRRIKEEGLCLLTHVVNLEREDGGPFSVDEAKKQIALLTYFLSLVKGSTVWVVCDAGFDERGERVWQSFCAPRLGEPPYWWADRSQGHQVEALFPPFVQRWSQSQAWRDCLTHAIYWYNQANTGDGQPGVDSALVLVQAALERLAFHYAVIERRMISRDGFKKLRASDQLRMLFSSLDIPMDIPQSLPAIQAASKPLAWVDSPHAITDIRNSLVHPDSNKRVSDCYFEAWKLSLWYLELSLLAVCGYEGTYQNRVAGEHAGQLEYVPWRSKITAGQRVT